MGSGARKRGRLLSQRQLRRLVSHLKGCLSSLTPVQTQALVLRTGLGLKHGYTRKQVARILHVAVKQEGQIERQATTGLTNASSQGRCGNPVAAMRTAVLRTLRLLVTAIRQFQTPTGAVTPLVASTGASSAPSASSPGRHAGARPRHSTGSAGSPSVAGQQPPPSSAAIAPASQGGFSWLLLALLIAAGLVALWFALSRLRNQPEGDVVAAPLRPRLGRSADARIRHLRRRGEALAGVIGLAALREAASARRRNRGAAAVERRGAHRPGLPPTTTRRSNGRPVQDVPASSAGGNGAIHDAPAPTSPPADTAHAAEKPRTPPKAQRPAAPPAPQQPPSDIARAAPPAPEHSLAEPAAAGAAIAGGVEAFELGGALAEKGDMAEAEVAYRRADEQGHPSAPSNLGVLLEQRGDFVGAEAAYRRADQRGDATGAFNLAAMLLERNDLIAAEEAFRRADRRGDAAAAYAVGRLLEERNDFFGAEGAFRRADDRGHSSAASSLGMLLENRGDLSAAEAAHRRADERGDATGAFRLGAMLEKRGDFRGAEAAYSRAADRGQGYVADLANAALSLLRSDR